ncbi:MAG TPA: hypothetical protein VKW04_20720, partial [Planctomycetota bacterium]|nr:hypothetical protein [Planctomycetota bacterium]
AKLAGEIPETSRIAWAALFIDFAGTFVPGRFPFGAVGDLASQPWRERSFYSHADLRGVQAMGFLEHPGDEVKIYPLYRPDFSRRIVPVRPGSADELLEILRREGLQYLYSPKEHEFVRDCVARNQLRRMGGGLFAVR